MSLPEVFGVAWVKNGLAYSVLVPCRSGKTTELFSSGESGEFSPIGRNTELFPFGKSSDSVRRFRFFCSNVLVGVQSDIFSMLKPSCLKSSKASKRSQTVGEYFRGIKASLISVNRSTNLFLLLSGTDFSVVVCLIFRLFDSVGMPGIMLVSWSVLRMLRLSAEHAPLLLTFGSLPQVCGLWSNVKSVCVCVNGH